MTTAADEFLRSCEDSERLPDVFEFLASRPDLSDREQVQVLLVDQFQRWKQNQVIPVDQYLERTPEISDILKVELLIEEFGYLDQRGIAPSPESFAKRYRALSAEATRELYDALEIEALSTEQGEEGTLTNKGSESKASTSADEPELIGRYEVIRLLGKGTFGRVYLARDPDLDRSVAIKVPSKKRIKMGGGADQFLNEAKAVAKLDHPNIVPVYDCGLTQDGRCFVVSKFVRGKELRSEIRKGISHDEAARMVGKLAHALHAAHVAGIVHRDVKPENVIVDGKRQPHLLDFGLAHQEHDEFDDQVFVGTPGYMSPEQAEGGSHRVDGRSDIYSLAVVFYELLTGHRPCKSSNTKDILAHLKSGEVRPPRQSDDTIPVELEEICLKALSRSMSDRFSTAKDMADRLEEWLVQSSISSEVGVHSSHGSQASGYGSLRSGVQSRSEMGSRSAFPFVAAVGTGLALAMVATGFWAWSHWGANSVPSSNLPNAESPQSGSKTFDLESGNRMAVLGFRNLTAEKEFGWMSTAFSELLIEELGKSDAFSMIGPENIGLMKSDLKLTNSETFGLSTLDRIRKRLDANWVVAGAYAVEGNKQVRLTLNAQNTKDPDQAFQFSESVERDRWKDLVTRGGAKLRELFELPAPNISGVGQLFPTSPVAEAAEDYFDGLAELRKYDPSTAIKLFSSAVQKDPESPLVHDGLAQALQKSGDHKAARQHAEKAVEFCAALPELRQLEMKGRKALLAGDPVFAIECYRSLLSQDSDSPDRMLLLSNALIAAGQGREALEMLSSALENPSSIAAQAKLELAAAGAAQSISEFAKQVEFAMSATASAQDVGALRLEGLAQLQEGQARRRTGEHDHAQVCFEKAIRIFDECGDVKSAATTYAAWGKALVDHGQLDVAEEKVKQGMELSKKIGNSNLIALNTGQLGEIDIYRGKFADAENLLQEAREGFEALGDWHGVAGMNLTLANVKARTGKLDEAIEMVGNARKAFQEAGDRRGEARTWGQEGAMRGRTGDSENAQRYFERALELFREVKDRRSMAICLGDLATTASNRGDLTKAGKLYSEALELHRQLGSRRGPEMVMFNLANLYLRTGKLVESEPLIKESFERFVKHENMMNACFVQRKMGDVQIRRGRLADAKATLNSSMEASKKVGSLGVQSQTLLSLAEVANYEGDSSTAIEHIRACRALCEQLKQDINVANCDIFHSRVELLNGNTESALELLRKGEAKLVSLKSEMEPVLLYYRAQLEAKLGKLKSANESFQKAEDAAKKQTTEDVSITLIYDQERAMALAALGRVEEAIPVMETLIAEAKKSGWVSLELEATTQRTEMLAGGEFSASTNEAITVMKRMRERGFGAFAKRIEKASGSRSKQ